MAIVTMKTKDVLERIDNIEADIEAELGPMREREWAKREAKIAKAMRPRLWGLLRARTREEAERFVRENEHPFDRFRSSKYRYMDQREHLVRLRRQCAEADTIGITTEDMARLGVGLKSGEDE